MCNAESVCNTAPALAAQTSHPAGGACIADPRTIAHCHRHREGGRMKFVPLPPEEAAKVRRELGLPEPRPLTEEERQKLAEEQVQAAVPLVLRIWKQILAEEAQQEKASCTDCGHAHRDRP